MKVIYDITTIGAARVEQRVRTGTFRVIENLAIGLSHHPECELIFRSEKYVLPHVKEYLKEVNYYGNYKISFPSLMNCEKYCLEKRKTLNAKIDMSDVKDIPLRIYRKLFTFSQAICNMMMEDIPSYDLRRADIYHSTIYNLPETIRENKKIKIFQTIYDMIPILYPQYFSDNTAQIMADQIKNFTEDDYILCISESVRNDFLDCNKKISPENVFVTYLGASDIFHKCESESEIENVKLKYKIKPENRYILSVATLEPRKNLHTLIKSFVQLVKSEKMNDLNLVLAGTLGWNYNSIFNEIECANEIKDKIIVTGYIDDADLSPLYTGALAFVYPSIYEGFGLPPLEAMQCGTPVITSNTSSLPEVIGDAGILVDPYDVDAISDAIYKIYNSDDLRKSMSQLSLERSKDFSWNKCVEDTVQAYKKAVSI